MKNRLHPKALSLALISLFVLFFLPFSNVYSLPNRGVEIVPIRDKAGKNIGLYKESHALVIGVKKYSFGWPSLPGVEKDVRLVKEALEKQGFNVVVVMDPDRDEMQKAFNNFIFRYGVGKDNRLLFYFAGHGHTLKLRFGAKMGYIVPRDAPNPDRDRQGFREKAMDMELFEVFAKRIEAKHALFLFDSCFSGSIFALERAHPKNITYKTNLPVRQFITAGSADESVPDESIFRQQFIAALMGEGDTDGDGYLTGIELGEFLQKKVVNYSEGSQHPQYGKIRNPHLDKGDFVFRLEKPKRIPAAKNKLDLELEKLQVERLKLEKERQIFEKQKQVMEERQRLNKERQIFAKQKQMEEERLKLEKKKRLEEERRKLAEQQRKLKEEQLKQKAEDEMQMARIEPPENSSLSKPGKLKRKIGTNFEENIFRMLETRDMEGIRAYILRAEDINRRNKDGWTPLMVATLSGDIQIVKILIEGKADMTIKNKDGMTAGFIAEQEGYPEIAKLLLPKGLAIEEQIENKVPQIMKSRTTKVAPGEKVSPDIEEIPMCWNDAGQSYVPCGTHGTYGPDFSVKVNNEEKTYAPVEKEKIRVCWDDAGQSYVPCGTGGTYGEGIVIELDKPGPQNTFTSEDQGDNQERECWDDARQGFVPCGTGGTYEGN